jgi:hypothetical protein
VENSTLKAFASIVGGLRPMKRNRPLISRFLLLATFAVFVAVFAADQYGLVQSFVRFLCTSCIGLTD